jgi:threonine/homoserine efflux transporter RhtA
LTFNINNSNAATALTGIGFTDTLPAGLVVSTPNGLTGSCGGGTITATAGSGSIDLTGASLAASTSCSFTVNVTATSNGTKVNVTTTVSSVEGGAGNAATAVLTVGVLAPIPTLSQWALLILSLLMLVAAGAVQYARRKS